MGAVMRTYIGRVTIHAGEYAITVAATGEAELALRWPPPGALARRNRLAVAYQECCQEGLVRWANVGPPGGEDTVLVATADLMEQIGLMFAIKVTASGEEE